MDSSEHRVEEIRERLLRARAVAVLTGAGISAESGVPTFRGKDGLWRRFRPEELATPEAFRENPRLVWEWYDWRRQILAPVRPNHAHLAIARLETRCKGFTLITQNVDGLHSLAGNKNILELHGNIWRVRCTACGKVEANRDVPIKILPMCGCGGLLRPDVVWFGEMLSADVLNRAFRVADTCDFMLVVGTSGVVQPAAAIALRAKGEGAFVVEVNLEKTPISVSVDATLTGKAGEILPMLVDSSCSL